VLPVSNHRTYFARSEGRRRKVTGVLDDDLGGSAVLAGVNLLARWGELAERREDAGDGLLARAVTFFGEMRLPRAAFSNSTASAADVKDLRWRVPSASRQSAKYFPFFSNIDGVLSAGARRDDLRRKRGN
jgi:hypothetical protein